MTDFFQLPGNGAWALGRARSSQQDVKLGKKAAFPLQEVCRLYGLAFTGLNLTTFNWYNWDLAPATAEGMDGKDVGGEGFLEIADGSRTLQGKGGESLGLYRLLGVH